MLSEKTYMNNLKQMHCYAKNTNNLFAFEGYALNSFLYMRKAVHPISTSSIFKWM